MTRPAILSIAGFDPTAGAGILTDAAVFRALGFHPLTVLTSVTAQGARTVVQIRALPQDIIERQLNIAMDEFKPAAVKIGMLYGRPAALIVAEFLEKYQLPAVLDPLIWSSSGKGLVRPLALPVIEDDVIPRCRLVTPNLVEARHFLHYPVETLSEAKEAAVALSHRWKTAVLLKGGHLSGDPVDILYDGENLTKFVHSRRAAGINVRGTGCALSAAIAAGLARDLNLLKAVEKAVDFVQNALDRHYLASNVTAVGFLDYPSSSPWNER